MGQTMSYSTQNYAKNFDSEKHVPGNYVSISGYIRSLKRVYTIFLTLELLFIGGICGKTML